MFTLCFLYTLQLCHPVRPKVLCPHQKWVFEHLISLNSLVFVLDEALGDEIPIIGRPLVSDRRRWFVYIHDGLNKTSFSLATEWYLSCSHFVRKAANCPHVNFFTIHDTLRDLWREKACSAFDRLSHRLFRR